MLERNYEKSFDNKTVTRIMLFKNFMTPSFKIFLVFVFTFILNLWMSWSAVSVPVIPDADIAADMLLANRIFDEGYLLVGHYSRWEFNHPGPFWFYWNTGIEIIFGWLTNSRWQLWYLGSVILSSIFLVFTSVSLSNYFYNRISLIFCSIFAVVLAFFVGPEISNIWMPNRMIAPYMAFIVSILQIFSGNIIYIFFATLSACILIHGYATMPFLTLPVLSLLLIFMCVRDRQIIRIGYFWKVIGASVGIGSIFFLPLVIDFVSAENSNLKRILQVNASFQKMPKPGWNEMFDFATSLLSSAEKRMKLVVWIPPLLLLFFEVFGPLREMRRKFLLACSLCLSVFLFSVLYYKGTPAPVYPFVAQFLSGIPVIVFSVVLGSCCIFLMDQLYADGLRGIRRNASMILLFFCVLVTIFYFSRGPRPFNRNDEISKFADLIIADRAGRDVVINYVDHYQWNVIAGLILELNRRHVAVCTTWSQMGFLYTRKHICGVNAVPTVLLVKAGQCNGECAAQANEVGLKLLP